MGFFKKIYESVFIRNRTGYYGNTLKAFSDLEAHEMMRLIQEIRVVSREREDKIKDYTEMLNDGITLSAVDLIAEDSTQYSEKKGATVWVESQDKDFEIRANDFLQNQFDVERMVYAIIFNIIAYGECYINTFYSDEEYRRAGSRVGEYFEIEEPDKVCHVYKFGKPSGYYVKENTKYSSRTIEDKLLTEKDFIHFIADKGMNREKITLEVPSPDGDGFVEKEYVINYGSSFLEAARTYFRTKILIDNILVLSRLSRSQFYRIFGIEVGNADSIETEDIVKEVKDAISLQRGLNLEMDKLSTVASPISTGGNIYIPTRQGKGSVQIDTTGGDTDVRAMLDVDYFDNQYYGALKVPKQFLGQAEDMPGGLGDTTLTRLDIRYARTCKRVQSVFREGIKDLIYWWGAVTNKSIPDFSVEMSKISTAEDDEKARSEAIEIEKVNAVLQLADRLMGESKLDEESSKELLRFLIEEVYGEQRISDILLGKKKKIRNEVEY